MAQVKRHLLLLCILLCVSTAYAQQVAFMDLASVHPPDGPSADDLARGEDCRDDFIGVMCGSLAKDPNEKIEVEIVGVAQGSSGIIVELKVRNAGQAAISIPWALRQSVVDSRAAVLDGYVVAWLEVSIRGGKGEKSFSSSISLYSSESRPWTIADIAPGEWAVVRFLVPLTCSDDRACLQVVGEHSVSLHAIWREYEYKYAHKSECTLTSYNMAKRHLRSSNTVTTRIETIAVLREAR